MIEKNEQESNEREIGKRKVGDMNKNSGESRSNLHGETLKG